MVTRQEVVNEARSWIETPYHLHGMVKGAGVDCGTLLYCVYKNCGIIASSGELFGFYSDDWFANTNEERYLLNVVRHAPKIADSICRRTTDAQPGNLVLSRCVGSRVFNHGGIVVNWPYVIHAVDPEVEQTCVMDHRLWAFKEISIFDPWAKKE